MPLDFTPGDPSVVVGVIDTGVAQAPDLAGKIDGLWSVALNGTLTSEPVTVGNDDVGHGTAVASLIAANVDDGFGMAGFGGATHLIAVRAGSQGVFYDTSVAVALAKLDALGVRIVNLSLGGKYPSRPIRERRRPVRLPPRHLVRGTRGSKRRCTDLGRPPRARELSGRRHHQAVRPPHHRDGLDSDDGLRSLDDASASRTVFGSPPLARL